MRKSFKWLIYVDALFLGGHGLFSQFLGVHDPTEYHLITSEYEYWSGLSIDSENPLCRNFPPMHKLARYGSGNGWDPVVSG
ncbi:hypothetical protein BGX38DRAFT_1214332 [Terfezia claveryi]|nr:hypothetical protein BGX38DRAFT_1214332 [Terfezia claveryi]